MALGQNTGSCTGQNTGSQGTNKGTLPEITSIEPLLDGSDVTVFFNYAVDNNSNFTDGLVIDIDGVPVSISSVSGDGTTGQLVYTTSGVFSTATTVNLTYTAASGTIFGRVHAIFLPNQSKSKSFITTDIIFETNFNNDSTYSLVDQSLTTLTNVPQGWSGAQAGGGTITALPGEGVDGSVAMKFFWNPTASQPTVSLKKHLTEDILIGYDDIYLRYNVRVHNNFKVFPGAYWKWGRLHQNTPITLPWTENREDSFYAMWLYGGGETFGEKIRTSFCANVGINLASGSSGGEKYLSHYGQGSGLDFSTLPGFFQSMGAGEWKYDPITKFLVNNTSQTWHTVEYRFKLSSTDTSGDGLHQVWYDGVEQAPHTQMDALNGAPEWPGLSVDANPTSRHGSGYNYFVFFDNMVEWNSAWDDAGAEGGVYVNDVVVSNTRIGHSYVAGNTDNIANGAT